MSKKSTSSTPTPEQIEKYELLSPMLNSFIHEMREFAKKEQKGITSALKVKMINRVLNDIKMLLAGESSISYLDLLDEEAIPQNSDVVIVLGQFRAAMNLFHEKNTVEDGYGIKRLWIRQ